MALLNIEVDDSFIERMEVIKASVDVFASKLVDKVVLNKITPLDFIEAGIIRYEKVFEINTKKT